MASTYDAASRVTAMGYRRGGTLLGDLTYAYDAAGNRTRVESSFARAEVPAPVGTATYDAANQQLTFGDRTLTFDANGNLTTLTDGSGVRTYSWNAREQLVGVSGPGVTASFLYDGLGRRERKTINGAMTQFVFDGVNPVQEIVGATLAATMLTGLGIDEYFARTETAGTSYVLSDVLGSTLALADATGTIQTEYTYEPFGATTTTGATAANPFQFTGREHDGTGLYYYRARYYHPTLQRFISEDPIGFAGGDPNLYAYVFNRPTQVSDALGLRPSRAPFDWEDLDDEIGGRKSGGGRASPSTRVGDRLISAAVGSQDVLCDVCPISEAGAGSAVKWLLDWRVIGPSPGFKHGGGTLGGIVHRPTGLNVRLDFHPLPGSPTQQWHINIGRGGESLHIRIPERWIPERWKP